MKYPDYNMKSIEKMIEWYKTEIAGNPSYFEHLSKTSPEYNAAHWLECYKKRTYKIPYNMFIKRLSAIRDSNMIGDYTRRVVNKLIGDKKLFKKMLFCCDGSYRNNRIWGHVDKDYRANKVMYMIEPDAQYHHDTDPVKLINWIYKHFDTIFVQMMPFETSDDLM